MNLMHLKYVVEIYKTKSFIKAAENLYMGQPNLSRAIKELEQDLGIKIFNRTKKGVEVTYDGEEFVQYAKKILGDVEEIEKRYTQIGRVKERFSILGPRSSYIGIAFAKFAKTLNTDNPMEIIYKETNSLKAINKVLDGEFRLGIIRYRKLVDKYFQNLFEEKGLKGMVVREFKLNLVVSKDHPLTKKEKVTYEDLEEYIEVCYPDPYVPYMPLSDVKKIELPSSIQKRIYIYERSSALNLLENLPMSFMWTSPAIPELLEKYNLVVLNCEDNNNYFQDVLICKKNYNYTEIDKRFLKSLKEMEKEVINELDC